MTTERAHDASKPPLTVTRQLIMNRLNLGKPIIRPSEMSDEQRLLVAGFLIDRMKDSIKAMCKFEELAKPPAAPGAAESFQHWFKVNQSARYFLSMLNIGMVIGHGEHFPRCDELH